MKKRMQKLFSLGLVVAMAGSMAACGGSSSSSSAAASSAASSAAASSAAEEEAASSAAEEEVAASSAAAETDAGADEGKVLNIQVWNDEFANRMKDHYPGFEANDPDNALAGGKIGDVQVNFIQTENQDNKYQNQLDSVLPGNADAADDDKTDIFLVEADYALKYVDPEAGVAMPLEDLGITDADLGDQYQYTKDIVTGSDGKLRGASWQACSAGLIYRRDIAKEVLGTDDPAEVQKAVADWATYNETAKKMKDAGYYMTATVNDTYRTYSNNVSAPWVQDGKVVVDDNIKAWVDDTKAAYDAGEISSTDALWSDTWSKGFNATDGKVFCYFGPAWLINFSMGNAPDGDDDGSVSHAGGWALTTGPQGYYWGGTWICAATGTDNPTLVKDIILNMTTNYDVMKDIAVKDSDCVNNKKVLADLAADDSFGNAILGGQNPYQMLADGAEKVDMSNISLYDQGCNEEFQNAMKNYFDGSASYDDALAQFNTAIVEKYPELTTE